MLCALQMSVYAGFVKGKVVADAVAYTVYSLY